MNRINIIRKSNLLFSLKDEQKEMSIMDAQDQMAEREIDE